MPANLVRHHNLPANFRLTRNDQWEAAGLGPVYVPRAGLFRANACLRGQVRHLDGPGGPDHRMCVRAALFFQNQMVPGSEVVVCQSAHGQWAVATAAPSWPFEADGPGRLEVRFSAAASPALINAGHSILGDNWCGVTSDESGRTWLLAEGPLGPGLTPLFL